MPPTNQPTKTIELKMVGRPVTVDQLKDKLKRIDDASKKAIFDTLDRLYEKNSETKVLESLEQFAAALAGSDVIENTRAASSDGVDLDFLLGINSFDIRALFQICKVDPSSPTSEDEFKAKLAEFLEIPNYEVTTPLPAVSAGETPESEASLEVKSVGDRVEALQERLGQKPDPKFIRLQQGVIRAISENFQEGKFIVQGLATELEMEMILEVLSSRFPEKFKTFGVMKDGFGYRLFCGQDGLPENYTQILPISRELERLSEVAESRSAVDTAYANMRDKQLGNKAAGGSRAWSIARFAAGYVKNLTIGFIPVVGYALSSYASLRAKMEEVGIYKGMIPTDSSFEWQAAVTRRRGVDGVFTLVCHDLSGDESDLKGYAFWARQYELMSRGFSYNQAVIVSVEQILPKVNSFPVAKALMALISDPQTYTDIRGSWALKGISLPDLSEIFDEANPRLLQPAGIEKLITAIHSLSLNIDQSQSLGLHRLLGVDVVSALSKVAQPTELDQGYLLKIQSGGSILGIIGIDGSKRLNKNTLLQAVLGGVSAVMGLTSTFAQAFKGSEYLLSGALEAMTRPAGTLANTWRRVVIARETRQMKHDAVTADSILGEILSTASMMSLGVVSYAIGTQLAGHQLADLMRNGGAANGLDKFLSGTGIKFFVRAAMALSVGAFGAAREARRGGSYQSSMEAAIRYGMGTWAGSSLYSAYDALGAFATNNGQMSMWQIAHDTLEDMKKAASGVPDMSDKLPEVPQDVDGISTPVTQIRYNKAGYTDTFSAAGFDEESAFANADESAGGRLNLPLQEQPDLQEQRSYQTGAASGYILDEQGQTRSWEEISRSLKPGITVSFVDGNGNSVSHVVQQGETLEQVLGTSDPEKLESFVRYNPGAFAATDEVDVITEVPVEDVGTTVLGSVASPDKTFQSTGSSLPNQETPPQAPPVAQPLNQQPAPQGAPVQPQVPYNFPSSSVDTANWKDDNAAALAARANMVASLAVAAGGQSNPAGLRSDILAGLTQEELAKIAGLTQQQIEAAGSVEGALKELGLSSSEAYQVSVIFTEGATVEKILRNSPTLVSVTPGSQALPQTIPNQPAVITQPQTTQTASVAVGSFASDNIPANTPISANQQQTLQVDPTYSGHISALDQWVNEAGNGSGGQERSSIAAYVRAILAVLDADGNGTIIDDQTLNNFRRVFGINGMVKQSDIVEIATALYIANDLDPKLNNLNISSFTSNPEAFKDLLINAHTSRPDLLALYVDYFVSKYKGAEEGIVTGMEIQNGQTPQGWAGSTEGGFSGNTSPFPPGSETLDIQSVVITEVLRNDELNTPLRLNGPTDLNASITYNRIPGQNAYSVIVPPDSRFLTFGRAFQGLPFAAQAWGYRAFEGDFETVTYLYVKPDDSSLGYIFDQNRQLIGIYNSEDGKTYWSSAGVTNEMELDLGGGRFVKMSVITSSTTEEIKAILSGQNPSTPVATETTDTSIPEPDANPQFGGIPNQQPSPISIPETTPEATPPAQSGTPAAETTAQPEVTAEVPGTGLTAFQAGNKDELIINIDNFKGIQPEQWPGFIALMEPSDRLTIKSTDLMQSLVLSVESDSEEVRLVVSTTSTTSLDLFSEVTSSQGVASSGATLYVRVDDSSEDSLEAMYASLIDLSSENSRTIGVITGETRFVFKVDGDDMILFPRGDVGPVTVSQLRDKPETIAIFGIPEINTIGIISAYVGQFSGVTNVSLTDPNAIDFAVWASTRSNAVRTQVPFYVNSQDSLNSPFSQKYVIKISEVGTEIWSRQQNASVGEGSFPVFHNSGTEGDREFGGVIVKESGQYVFYDANGELELYGSGDTQGYKVVEYNNRIYLVHISDTNSEFNNVWQVKPPDVPNSTGELLPLEDGTEKSRIFDLVRPGQGPTAEITPEIVSTEEATAEVAAELTDEPTEAPTATTTPSYTPTLTPTPEPSNTPTPTSTTESTATLTPTDTPTDVLTQTPEPIAAATSEPSPETTPAAEASIQTKLEDLGLADTDGDGFYEIEYSPGVDWTVFEGLRVEEGFKGIAVDTSIPLAGLLNKTKIAAILALTGGQFPIKFDLFNNGTWFVEVSQDGYELTPSDVSYSGRLVMDKAYGGIAGALVSNTSGDGSLTFLDRSGTGGGYSVLMEGESIRLSRVVGNVKNTWVIELEEATNLYIITSEIKEDLPPTPTPTSTTEPTATLTPTDIPTDVPTETLVPTDRPTNTPTATNTVQPTYTPEPTITLTPTPEHEVSSPESITSKFFFPPLDGPSQFNEENKVTRWAGLRASFDTAANALKALYGEEFDTDTFINEFINNRSFTGDAAIDFLDTRSNEGDTGNLDSDGTTPIMFVDGKFQVGALLFRVEDPNPGLVNEEIVQAAIYNKFLDNVTANSNIYGPSLGIWGMNDAIDSLGGYPVGEGRLRTVAEAMQIALIYEANINTGAKMETNYDFQTFGGSTPTRRQFDDYAEVNDVVTQWKENVLSLLTVQQQNNLGIHTNSSNTEFIKLLLDPQKYEELDIYLAGLGSFEAGGTVDTIHAFELISMSRGIEGGTDDTVLGITQPDFDNAKSKVGEISPTEEPTALPTPPPTETPTDVPTETPVPPTETPTTEPTNTPLPTDKPTNTPPPTASSTSSSTPEPTSTTIPPSPTLTPTEAEPPVVQPIFELIEKSNYVAGGLSVNPGTEIGLESWVAVAPIRQPLADSLVEIYNSIYIPNGDTRTPNIDLITRISTNIYGAPRALGIDEIVEIATLLAWKRSIEPGSTLEDLSSEDLSKAKTNRAYFDEKGQSLYRGMIDSLATGPQAEIINNFTPTPEAPKQ